MYETFYDNHRIYETKISEVISIDTNKYRLICTESSYTQYGESFPCITEIETSHL